jgi:hypothetical protein
MTHVLDQMFNAALAFAVVVLVLLRIASSPAHYTAPLSPAPCSLASCSTG